MSIGFAKVSFVAILLVLCVRASDARADNYWSTTGAQCNVVEDSVVNSRYMLASGGIKFAAGKTGTIALFCAVSRDSGATNPNTLYVHYQDTDLTVANTKVLARLFRMNRFTSIGAITQIGTDITSATPAIAGAADNYMLRTFSHTLDFTNNFYFIYVELTRASTAQQAIVAGVSLDYVVP